MPIKEDVDFLITAPLDDKFTINKIGYRIEAKTGDTIKLPEHIARDFEKLGVGAIQ